MKTTKLFCNIFPSELVIIGIMTKNPIKNALAALCYIVLIILCVFYAPKVFGDVKESILLPIMFLSLFTLSAAVMGYLFLFQPAELYFSGSKKEGVRLFL